MKGLCALLATLVAAAGALTAAGAEAASPHANTGTTRSLSKVERLILGPEHAAEHAGLRMLARMEARRWRRMSPAQRRRAERRARAAAARVRAADAGLDPAVFGKWTSGPFRIPVAAIHMALLPTGKVIFFAFPFRPESNPPTDAAIAGDAWLWDPAKGNPDTSTTADPSTESMFTHVVPPFDPETNSSASLFCAGLALMANGDLMTVGGTLEFPNPNEAYHYGLKRVYTFNPWTETWIHQPDMLHGRWYPSVVELPDGRMAVLAGLNETGTGNNPQLEVFTPSGDPSGVGSWQHPGQGDRQTDLYPHMTLMGDGKVLLAGPGQTDTALLDPATMTWTNLPAQDARRTYGTELLEPNGTGASEKITEIGGFPDKSGPGSTFPAVKTSISLDLSVAPPQWTPGPSLQVARANHNTLWLPDGTELTIGGGNGKQNNSTYVLQNGSPEHQIELYDPKHPEKGWVLGPAQQIDRAYHSTAVLLPDGRVLSAGDDNPYVYNPPVGSTPHPYEGSDHNSGEIYSPPYLFRGTRPQIDSAPEAEDYGAAFHVALSQLDPQQAHAVLIPPAASTHSTNPNPRIVPLQSAPTEDGLNLTAPANADIAPPGYYMLFVINSDGVPSVARWVRIGTPDPNGGGTLPPETTPTPAPAIPQPAARPAIRTAVEWLRVTSRQSFRKKGYVVAYLGLAQNDSTINASLLLTSGHSSRAKSQVLAKTIMRKQRAGTVKLVVRLSAAQRRLLTARQRVILRVRVSAPGAPPWSGDRRISNKG